MDNTRNLKLYHTFKAEIIFFTQSSQDPTLMAVVCKDNSLIMLETMHCKVKKRLALSQCATDIQFDPLSANYMVVCLKNGEMIMYETESFEEVRCTQASAIFGEVKQYLW